MTERGIDDKLIKSSKISDSAESFCNGSTKLKRRSSVSFPTCGKRSFSGLQCADENPNVSITVTDIPLQITSKENDYLKTSVGEGNCIEPFCVTCPTSNHERDNKPQEKHKRDSSHQNDDHQHLKHVQGEELKYWIWKILSLTRQLVPKVQNPHTKFVHWRNKIFIISCLLATFVDPLFFFLLSVQRENKCIVFDWTLAWAIVGLRSIIDLFYLFHMLLQFRLAFISRGSQVAGSGVLVADPKKVAPTTCMDGSL